MSWTVTEQLKFFTLFVSKRLDWQIVLRFSMAEVRINASTNELLDRLTQGLLRIEGPADQSLRTLQVSVAGNYRYRFYRELIVYIREVHLTFHSSGDYRGAH